MEVLPPPSDRVPRMSGELPDGAALVALGSPSDCRFVVHEVYRQRVYAQHGVVPPTAGVVFDVGANVGVFTLWLAGLRAATVPAPRRQLRVFAFEPAPTTAEVLAFNTRKFADGPPATRPVRVHIMRMGLLDSTAAAMPLTFLPSLTSNSTFAPATAQLPGDAAAQPATPERYSELGASAVPCRVTTVSAVLDRYAVPRVALLKLDVEGSEARVLRGVQPRHWPRIDQVAAEVHDVDGRVAEVAALLRAHFDHVHVHVDAAVAAAGFNNAMVYASRTPGK